VNAVDSRRQTALVLACKHGHGRIANALLDHSQLDVNLMDNHGRTPIVVATRYRYKGLVESLLHHPQIEVKLSAMSAVHAAGHWDTAQLLEDFFVGAPASLGKE
jgi:ankyrin repeat protein